MDSIVEVLGEGLMPWLCYSPAKIGIKEGDICVINVNDLLEYGKVVKVRNNLENSNMIKGRVLRRATLQDRSIAQENKIKARQALRRCEEKIKKLKLNMNVVKVYYSFDRTLLTIQYTSDERVDFRQLIYELNNELKIKIYMHQVSPRQVASSIGGFAPCGRQLCCSLWLKELDNIHIHMAKQQQLFLSNSVINGMCGKLKCCLKFEYEQYKELSKDFPTIGSIVKTSEGLGKVVGCKILSKKIQVSIESKEKIQEFALEDVSLVDNISESKQ